MKKSLLSFAGLILLFSSHAAFSDEIGLGRDHDIPDSEPVDPTAAEASSLWQELLEWVNTDAGQ